MLWGDVLVYTQLANEYYMSEYLSRVTKGAHNLAGPFLSHTGRLTSHCAHTSWVEVSWARPGCWDSHVLAIGRRSCCDKTSANPGSESYVTRNKHSPKVAQERTKGAHHCLLVAMWPIHLGLYQMPPFSDLKPHSCTKCWPSAQASKHLERSGYGLCLGPWH